MSDKPQKPPIKPKPARPVGRVVLSEALQHPTTLAPAACAILTGAYLGMIGLNKTALALAMGSGLLSLCSFVYHYMIRGDAIARKHANNLIQQKKQAVVNNINAFALRCTEVGFSEGAKQAHELLQVYGRLRGYLDQRSRRHAPALRFADMSEDCCKEALRLLESALTIHQALAHTNAPLLTRERDAWVQQRADLTACQPPNTPVGDERITALTTKIEAHDRRLSLYRARRGTYDTLLAEYEVLEAALSTAYLEVVELLEHDVDLGSAAPAHQLEQAVRAARLVEDRLRAMENPHFPEDETYRRAGTARPQAATKLEDK